MSRFLNGLEFLDTVRAAIGVETLAATKTLITTDYVVQWIDPDGAERDVVFPAEASSLNLLFIITNTGSQAGFNLVAKNDAAATIDTIGPGMTGIFSCDGTNWKHENDTGMFYDSVSGFRGIGTTTPDTLLQLINDAWISAKNFAGTSYVNVLKVTEDNTIAVGGQLDIGAPIIGPEDGGQIMFADMPVSATPAAGLQQSFTLGIDGDNCLTWGAFADGVGGVSGHFIKNHGAVFGNVTVVNAATYDLLGSDYILNVTYTGTAAVTSLTLPTAQCVVGRIISVKDAGYNANTNNITIDTEGAEKINNADTYVINADGNSIDVYSDGTNWHVK